MDASIFLWALALLLVVIGFAGLALPALPGAPVLFAKRAGSDKLRLVTDYRGLNAVTKPSGFALPHQEDLLNLVASNHIYTQLDLAQAFHGIAMAPDSVQLTAFNCAFGSFEWRSMPFGLVGASFTQQRCMSVLFADLIREGHLAVYLDDLVILSPEGQEDKHRQLVEEVLRRLDENNLRLRRHKSRFMVKQIDFLGFRVSHGNIEAHPDKIEAIVNWPAPKTCRQTRRFLGMCNFLRRFVRSYADISKPLTAIVNKFQWGEPQQRAFDKLKDALSTAPVLAAPQQDQPYEVHTDASDVAVGAGIMQEGRVVAYMSQQLNKHQRNYDVRTKEALAIHCAFRKYRYLLMGPPVSVYSDHESLLRLPLPDNQLPGRLARWHQFLSDFNIVHWYYRRGRQHDLPDALSRIYVDAVECATPTSTTTTTTDVTVSATSSELIDVNFKDEEWSSDYLNDNYYKEIMAAHGKNELHLLPPRLRERCRYWEIIDDKVHVQHPGRQQRLAVPQRQQRRILEMYHGTAAAGHPGMKAMARAIRERYFWPKVDLSCKAFIMKCDACLRSRDQHQHQGPTRTLPPPTGRWRRVQCDFITGLPASNGFDSICTFRDDYSKRVHLAACRTDITAEQFSRVFLHEIVRQHGRVSTLLTDRDSKFTATFWRQLAARLGVKLDYASTDHHHTVGGVERANRTVEQQLRALVHDKPEEWSDYLDIVEYTINNTVHTSLKMTPFEADLGYPVTRLHGEPQPQLDHPDHAERQRQNLHLIDDHLQQAREITVAQSKMKFDVKFQTGDLVLLRAERIATDAEREDKSKLHARFRGPFKVLQVLDYDNYQLELPPSSRAYDVFHVSNLIRYTDTGNPDAQMPPPEEDNVYAVDKILGHRVRRRQRRRVPRVQGLPPQRVRCGVRGG